MNEEEMVVELRKSREGLWKKLLNKDDWFDLMGLKIGYM